MNDPQAVAATLRMLPAYRRAVTGLRLMISAVLLAILLIIGGLLDVIGSAAKALLPVIFLLMICGLLVLFTALIPLSQHARRFVRDSSGFPDVGRSFTLIRMILSDVFPSRFKRGS